MRATDIPTQVLNEAYRAVAERSETDFAKLDRDKIGEDEFMAALAFTQAAPLIEATDVNEVLLNCCEALSRDLDLEALADYKFVPLANRGQIVAITSSPWDLTTMEAIRSYFPQCSRVRFVLTSPDTLAEILSRLNGSSPETAPVADDLPKPATAAPPPLASQIVPEGGTQASSPRLAPAISVAPTDHTALARQLALASPAPAAQQNPTQSLLSPEDTAHLINALVKEANELLQRRRRTQL